MSDDKAEKLNALLAQTEQLAELERRLGPTFTLLVQRMETAETELASCVDAQKTNDDTQELVLQFLGGHFAAKAGLYGAGVCLGFGVSPSSAFEILQNRVLAGFHSSFLKHRDACKDPGCEAAAPLGHFLAEVAAAVNQIQTASAMLHVQRDASGNPIVH